MSNTTNELNEKEQQAVADIKKQLVALGLDKKMDKNDYDGEVIRFSRTCRFNINTTLDMIKKYTVI
jgi:hypothetical protein